MTRSRITNQYAVKKLKEVIDKSRSQFYKPIQVAEILYHWRTVGDIDLLRLEDYRNSSKRWRDEISSKLVGSTSSSSAKFQDNLFEDNAIPPAVLNQLGIVDKEVPGSVEAYIYRCFSKKYHMITSVMHYVDNATPDTFFLSDLLDMFWDEQELRRSIDKVYEIVTYALFEALIGVMDTEVHLSVNPDHMGIVQEFAPFTRKVLNLNPDEGSEAPCFNAAVYRVGSTNAADRGLDLYCNWGPAVQVKHLNVGQDLVNDILKGLSSDWIIIVCQSMEDSILATAQKEAKSQGRHLCVVLESELVEWYEKVFSGDYAAGLGKIVLSTIQEEMKKEFPHEDGWPAELEARSYELVSLDGIEELLA
jgi:hypothetical protein